MARLAGPDRASAKIAWERSSVIEELKRIRKNLPIYILAGDADPVNQNLEALKPVAQRYRAAGVSNVTERYYDGGRHEMFNEINREQVMRDLLEWLQTAVPA